MFDFKSFLEDAIKNNHADEMTQLAQKYLREHPAKVVLAIILLENAIKLGDPAALLRRADLYMKGLGSSPAYFAAIKLIREALSLNHSTSNKYFANYLLHQLEHKHPDFLFNYHYVIALDLCKEEATSISACPFSSSILLKNPRKLIYLLKTDPLLTHSQKKSYLQQIRQFLLGI